MTRLPKLLTNKKPIQNSQSSIPKYNMVVCSKTRLDKGDLYSISSPHHPTTTMIMTFYGATMTMALYGGTMIMPLYEATMIMVLYGATMIMAHYGATMIMALYGATIEQPRYL